MEHVVSVHFTLHYPSATAKTNNYSDKARVSQSNICICCLESSILHTWVLGTLCKAYLEHTLPGVERRASVQSPSPIVN